MTLPLQFSAYDTYVSEGTDGGGKMVNLTPMAAEGSNFTGWGGACTGMGMGPCTAEMDQDRSVVAMFDTA